MVAQMDLNNLLWIVITVPLLMLCAAAGFWLVKRKFKPDQTIADPAETPFTLDQVRQLHRQGQISDEECRRLKDKILNQTRRDLPDE